MDCFGFGEAQDRLDATTASALAGAAIALALACVSRRPGRVTRFPRTVLAALAAVTVAAGAALVDPAGPALRLSIDPSTEPLLPADDPAHDAYERAVLAFGDDEVFVVAMETDDVFTEENLRALRRISHAVSRLPGVRSVSSLVDVTNFRYQPEDDWIAVQPFIEEVPEAPEALARLRERALAHPVYRQTLVSVDGRAAALNVTFREMTDREFIASGLDEKIRAILEGETTEGRRFHVSGRPHIKAVMYHAMTRDLLRLIPIAVAILAAVLAVVAGTVRGVVLPLLTVTLAVLWTFGAIAFLERPLTVLTVLLAPTLVAIGSVYGVHVITRYEEEAARSAEPEEAARRTLGHVIFPVAISGLTTAVGFGALLVTDVPAVFELGAFSVFGIGCITLLAVTLVPAVLALLPLRPAAARRIRLAGRIDRLLDARLADLARASRRHSGAAIAVFAALAALAAAAVPRIEIDTDYLSYFEEGAEVRREFEAINRLLAGAIPLFVVFEGDERGWLRDPEVLRALAGVEERLGELPGVTRTLSFLATLRLLNRAIEADDPAAERIPDSRGAVAELLFMVPKDDMQRFATVDQRATNVIARTGEVGSAAVRRLSRRMEAVISAVPVPGALRAFVTGNAILLSRAADGVARSQALTVGLAALTIFSLLAVGLRSPRLGLVAMVPNAVPVLFYFGVLGAGAAPLSLPTSLIGSVALGIAIDATVHFLVRYRNERAAGCGPEEAALRAGRRVGRPIGVTSTMLVLGFLSIAFSEFQTLQQFAWLSALTMGFCCLTDLVLLPALLVRLRL